jgi:excisionase family DNA binding protein
MPTEITVAEWAQLNGVSTQLVYRWILQGRLSARRQGSITLISSRAKRPQPRRRGRRQKEPRC